MAKHKVSLVVNNSGYDRPYNQMATVEKEDTSYQEFISATEQWEKLVEENKSNAENDDELLLLWEKLGWKVSFLNPDFELNI